MSNGIQISQQGIPVERAADYQKVLDSRWRFMEVEQEVEVTVDVPAANFTGANYFQRVTIVKHNLGFVPAFHASAKLSDGTDPYGDNTGIYCNDKEIYIRRMVYASSNRPALSLTLKGQIYNLPILEEYLAPSEATSNVGRTESNIGVRALDGTDSKVEITSNESHGFAVDTRKKVLSVHKVTTKHINEWVLDSARVNSVDTAADTFAYIPDPNPAVDSTSGVSWIATGVPFTMSPNDFATYPGPLSDSTYYMIKVSDSKFKVALSKENADAGIAVDITSTGSLPLQIRRAFTTGDDRIPHESGYPPSFFFCEYINDTGVGLAGESLRNISTTPLIRADTNYLYFTGVQAVYRAQVAAVILKDPMEVAQ